jgi:hypothetical protein
VEQAAAQLPRYLPTLDGDGRIHTDRTSGGDGEIFHWRLVGKAGGFSSGALAGLDGLPVPSPLFHRLGTERS